MGQGCKKNCDHPPHDCFETAEEFALKNHELDFENQRIASENVQIRRENERLRRELVNSGRALRRALEAENWSKEQFVRTEEETYHSEQSRAELESYIRHLEEKNKDLMDRAGEKALGPNSAHATFEENIKLQAQIKSKTN
eukprot:gnl/MRDRNA2_/MRDRNA2_91453_c0_seq1.p1 gnl/MRDRNA2_/MRDRNA2_91453_c0~~gnl/MRDRNA2_/MRDRNA2_91453_c0_seq1.p1  ORF type:complete len:141 (+),score=31.03 gnl/MRDRNA2_/MRDRNA2_91453_c0_seq1:63-485(+)